MDMLLVVILVAACFGARVFLDSRGICFLGGKMSTDNEKMLKVASQIKLSSWPSGMHRFSFGRGQLREFWVMGVSLMGRLYDRPVVEHVNVSLGLLAHAISGILSFIILSHFFGVWPAFFCALLYLGSYWGYQVSIYLGHVIFSQMWFLLALVPLIWVNTEDMSSLLGLSLASGALTAICFFASSASRKYPPMSLVVFMVVLAGYLGMPKEYATQIEPIAGIGIIWALFAVAAPYISLKLVSFLEKKLTKSWSPKTRNQYQYEIAKLIRKIGFGAAFFAIFAALFVQDYRWFAAVSAFALGSVSIVLYILLPNILENTVRYYTYLNIGTWANHFNSYPDHIKTFGRHLPDNFRGEGMQWVPKFFMRVIPIPFLLYCLSVVVLLVFGMEGDVWGRVLLVLFLSILPTLVTEITKGLQVGKSYFPSFLGLLIAISAAIQLVLERIPDQSFWVLLCLSAIVGVHLIWNIYLYRTDVLPSRMGPARLRERLRERKITHFFSYDTAYNDGFVKTMLYSYPGEFSVQYVRSIEEAGNEGVFVVPPSSSKSVAMETQQFSILNGDFRQDSVLNELLDTGRIEKIALERIKTLGSSRVYVHESEVTSFRDLGLHQIADRDRWLGHGWVIDLATINQGRAR